VTVASTTNKASYNGNGTQSVFAYTFKIFVDADIKVYVGTTLKTINTHYTLSGVGATGGGNVTFTSGNIPAAGTGNVTLLRSLALTQGVDLVNYGRFDAEVVESQYDKLTMMVQQLQEQADRTIRFNTTVSDAGGVEITDTVAERSGKVLAYDANGDLSVANELGDWQGNWTTSRTYAVRDLALDAATNNVYTCLISHTSGTLSTDVAASKWALVINAAAVAASAATATTKASEASTSASTASTQATNSANSATAAASSASTASTQASTATTQASTATTKASEASTSASNAATSASAGATSATNAANSATAGANSATASANSASGASTSASTATTKASEASTSASTATTKASEAATSATNSANSATASANSATASANSATASANSASTAGTQATNSANSATASANSAASAAAAFDNFDDKYLGAKGSEPSVNNDGDALVTGNLYFLTGTGMQVYDGANWIAASSSGNVSMYVYEYIATANQTTFSGADSNSQTLSYAAGNIIVSYGGYDLPKSDYTATNGTSVVLDDGAVVGEIVRIVAFQSFVVANTYTQSQADTLLAAKSPLASPSFTGNVGIGISSPAEMLEIYNTSSPAIQLNDGGDYKSIMRLAGNDLEIRGSSGSLEFYNGAADGDSSALAMTINNSGNVGIGVVPEAHHNTHSALQVGGNGVWTSYKPQGASGEMDFQHNAYYSQAHGGDRYISTDEATKYRQVSGAHQWYTAGSGSADAAISWRYGMQINNDGIVTKPLQPAFSVDASQQLNFPISTVVTVPFDVEVFDVGANFNTSTKTFTAPITGKYHLNVTVHMRGIDSAAAYYEAILNTSNRLYYNYTDGEGGTDPDTYTLTISHLCDMDVGDTAYVTISQSGGAAQTDLRQGCHFSGYLAL
jgi:hypothetical protein